MNLTKPSHLKKLCKQYSLTPSKKYGQNFLISQAPIEKMIKAAEIKKGDRVVEIGPGFGVLTFSLLEQGAKVVAFEIEKKLEEYWRDQKIKRSKDQGEVEVIWGNALDQIKKRSSDLPIFRSSYKVIANLPYQITSNALRTLLELKNKPESITVMVQKEVAQRIVAKPGNMSLLAVSIQYYGDPKIVCKVSKGNFWPEPKVDSAVIHLTTLPPDHRTTISDKDFFKVVRAGFSNKRKQLWRNLFNSLDIDKEKINKVLKQTLGNEKARAQELSVEQWISIAKLLL